jgi:hypothetical protein
MWENSYDRDYLLAYNFSKEFIRRNCPAEETYFEKIWQTATPLYHTWDDLEPPRTVQDKILSNLNTLRRPEQLKTPQILAIVLTCINLLKIHQPTSVRFILSEVGRLSGLCGSGDTIELQLLQNLYHFLKLLGRVSPLGCKTYTPQDLLNPDFEFGHEIYITWHKNQPLVILDEKEILEFRSQVSLFATLLYLATKRKSGDGWIHRRKELNDPGEHRISSLRSIFKSIPRIEMEKPICGEIIRTDNKGNVKLALHANNIFIYTEIVNFRCSEHEKLAELSLEECGKWFKDFQRTKEEKYFKTLLHATLRLEHHYVPFQKNVQQVKRATDLLHLEFNYFKKYEEIKKRYELNRDNLQDAGEWSQRFSKQRS